MKQALVAFLAGLLFPCVPVLAAGAHVHGNARVDIAIEGGELTIALDMPLDGLVGFERAPRTEAERNAAAAALARMREGDTLFRPSAQAQCKLSKVTVTAPVLEPGHKPQAGSEHADLEASYVFACAQPAALAALDIALFDAFKRLQRIDIQAALPHGQSKATLRRPARQFKLVK